MTVPEFLDLALIHIRAGQHDEAMVLWEEHGPRLTFEMTFDEQRELTELFECVSPYAIAASLRRTSPTPSQPQRS